MSILGAGNAGGIAQTVQQAQQVARQRDQQQTQASTDARKVRDQFDSHLKSFEDSTSEESSNHLHVDGQMPEHQTPEQGGGRRRKPHPAPAAKGEDAGIAPSTETLPETDDDHPLYRHLDVQA